MVNIMNNLNKEVNIAIVGKYTSLGDAYISLVEALKHAQIPNKTKVKIHWLGSESLEDGNPSDILSKFDGILIPGGFGKRGIEGMVMASKFARENQVPYLGICLGLQIAIIDFARNVLHLPHANSTEFDPGTPYPVVDIMPEQRNLKDKGGSMRLGAFTCKISGNTKASKIYNQELIQERHRHRYEFNNSYKVRYENSQVVFSGLFLEKNLVEIMELPGHPFFIGCQYHPELISRPTRPEPVFSAFIEAAVVKMESKS
jgi:CTP synthase